MWKGIVIAMAVAVASVASLPSMVHCMYGPTYRLDARFCLAYDQDGDSDIDLLDFADWVIDHPDGTNSTAP